MIASLLNTVRYFCDADQYNIEALDSSNEHKESIALVFITTTRKLFFKNWKMRF